jgi:transcription elongation factor Elf1
MSVFIDRTFLLRMSPRLPRFTKKKDDLYNFRCPLCGDSQKNKTKSRGFVYRKQNDYFYMCHNCGVSTTFYNFLKSVDPSLLKEYQLERYKNGETGNNNYPKPEFEEFKTEKPIFKKALELPTIESLPEAHFAKSYVHDRRIPKAFHSQLYYAFYPFN